MREMPPRFELNRNYLLYNCGQLGKYFLFDITSGKIFRLNKTGFVALDKLASGSALEEVAELIVRECKVELEIVRRDLEAWVTHCLNLGILKECCHE